MDTEEEFRLLEMALNNQLTFRLGMCLTSWERKAAWKLYDKGYPKCVALRIVIPKKGTRICVD